MADGKIGKPTYTADYIKSDYDKAVFLDNPHNDNIVTAMLNFGAEFWSMRRRQIIMEKILTTKGSLTAAAIDEYRPSEQERLALEQERDEFISRVFSVLTRPTAQVSGPAPQTRVPALTK